MVARLALLLQGNRHSELGTESEELVTTATKERRANERKLANNYARAFNRVAEGAGIDLPMGLCVKLVELFSDALDTGASLERADRGQP